MADLKNPTATPQAPDQARRRALLRAAAAAPFLATIPSGAARAIASNHQCMMADARNQGGIAGVIDTQDYWVRTPISVCKFQKEGTAKIRTLYHVDGVLEELKAQTEWYSQSGNNYVLEEEDGEFFVKPFFWKWRPVEGTLRQEFALVVFQPVGAPFYTGVTLADSERSVYPRVQLAENLMPGDNANMGLSGSCLASIGANHMGIPPHA